MKPVIHMGAYIVFDARKIYDYGVGTHIQGLLTALLDHAGHQYEWVIIFPEKASLDFLPSSRSHIQVVYSHVKPFSFASLTTFSRFINAFNPDIYHNPYFPLPLSIHARTIVTIHDTILLDRRLQRRRPWVVPLAHRLMNLSVKRADRIFTVSPASAKDIVRHFPTVRDRLRIIPNGLPQKFWTPPKPSTCDRLFTSMGIQKHAYFLYVGNVKPHKNLQPLLEAWVKGYSNHRMDLVLAGPGPEARHTILKHIPESLRHHCHEVLSLSL